MNRSYDMQPYDYLPNILKQFELKITTNATKVGTFNDQTKIIYVLVSKI
jgi:hypothetical protein